MLSSPTSPLPSSSSSSTSTSTSTLHPEPAAAAAAHRRRSVDNGGLSLALNDHARSGSGKGWGGWEVDPAHLPSRPTDYAELVLAMREQTATAIYHACPSTHPSSPLVSPSELVAERTSLIHTLASWHCDTSQLSPDDALKCASLIFESLWSIEGMQDSIGIELETIHPFLTRISKIYRRQTSYHNFQHAVDVLQAVYCYLHAAGCVPGVHILLDEDPLPVRPDERKFDAGIPSPEDPNLPPKRRRKMWRPKPPLEGKRDTLLKRALRNQDIFALCVAAVGHDIAHPGVSNKFLSNAKAPLAELFDDVSVLEKFHCTVLLHVMRTHHMAHLLDRPSVYQRKAQALSTQSRFRTGSDPGVLDRAIDPEFLPDGRKKMETSPTGTRPTPPPAFELFDAGVGSGTGTEFRELLMQAILATDMSVHFKWMTKLDNLLQKVERNDNVHGGCGEEVDYETRLLLSQALIKCADISNPSRPVPICKHWSSSLNSEWAEQALLEKQLELPISVMASDDPIEAGKAQVAFIEAFTLPLLQATSAVIPEMEVFVNQCNVNLDMWKTKIRDSIRRSMNGGGGGSQEAGDDDDDDDGLTLLRDDSPTAPPSTLPTSPPDVSTMFALSLPTTLHAPPGAERTQALWPDRVSSPSLAGSQSDHTDSSCPDEPTAASTPSDSRSPSPPPPPQPPPPPPPAPPLPPRHHRHTPHARLPQVSIPQAAPASLAHNHYATAATAMTTTTMTTNSHAKSSSTTSVASPLFSPRSVPTSSSSPRSESSGGDGSVSGAPVAAAAALRVVLPSLRAAYEANGRPKPARRLENRFSWQGGASSSAAVAAGASSSSSLSVVSSSVIAAVPPPPPPLFADLPTPQNHLVPAPPPPQQPPHALNGSR